MFAHKRDAEERESRRREQEYKAEEEYLRRGTDFVRAVYRIFDGASMTVDGKRVYMKCDVRSSTSIAIDCSVDSTDAYGIVESFVKSSAFEERVKSAIRSKLISYGYHSMPIVHVYC